MIVYPLMNSSNIVLSATIPNATILQDMQLSQNCNVDMQLFQHCNVDMQLSQTCNPAIKTSIAYPLGFGTKPYQTTGSPTREAQHVLDIRMPPDPRCWDSENTVVSRHQTWRAGKSTMKIHHENPPHSKIWMTFHHIQKYGWHFYTFFHDFPLRPPFEKDIFHYHVWLPEIKNDKTTVSQHCTLVNIKTYQHSNETSENRFWCLKSMQSGYHQ